MKKILIALTALLIFNIPITGFAIQIPSPLVDTDWLVKHQNEVVILDIRYDVKSFVKKPVYKKDKKTGKQKLVKVGGHIEGARLVKYKKIRVNKTIGGNKITRMIPAKGTFESLMQAVGVNKDSAIVIVSRGHNDGDVTMATRLYWQLKYYGQDNMALLNGGTAQWIIDGHDVVSDDSKPAKGNWVATTERQEIYASSEEVVEAMKTSSTQLIDIRPMSQYLGTYRKSYVYADGHIPGAKVFPNELLTRPKLPAKFTETDKIKTLLPELGIDPQGKTIAYCNSGALATGSWFVMSELLGNKNVRLYDGSMHQWTLEKRPVTSLKME